LGYGSAAEAADKEELMGAPVAFFEVISTDPERIPNVNTRLFGWTVGGSGTPDYYLADTGAGDGAIGSAEVPQEAGRTAILMRVDDLQAYLNKAERLGGKTLMPPTGLGGDVDSIAMFADPDCASW
jgi:uncharacterized protein